jgi:hypothetical protein
MADLIPESQEPIKKPESIQIVQGNAEILKVKILSDINQQLIRIANVLEKN